VAKLGLLVIGAMLAAGCGGDDGDGVDRDAAVDRGPESGAGDRPADAADAADAAGLDVPAADAAGPDAATVLDVAAGEPPPPGRLAGAVINDSSEALRLAHDIQFRITVEGAPAISTMARQRDGKWTWELEGVPAGRRALIIEELDGQGGSSLDLFTRASRRIEVDVAAGQSATGDFHLVWHWQPHKVEGGPDVRTCQGLRQLAFGDRDHGLLVFKQEAGDGGIAELHAAAMSTDDGGVTWKVASKRMVTADYVPWSGNWWGGHSLALLADGVVLSLPQFGPVVRSGDGGKTWQALAFFPPTWGPGNRQWSGIARSGGALYLPVWSGGVQSSSERVTLSRSTDGGISWQVLIDRCDRSEPNEPCANPAQPNLPVGFAGNDIACGPVGHCIVAGTNTVLVTTDDFATHQTFSLLPPEYGCGYATTAARVYWLPGTQTAWVVAPASACGNPPPLRRITTDGGRSWSAWQPSPVSAAGDLAWGDSQTGFALEVRGVNVTHDGGATWKSTGAAPHDQGSNDGLRLSVVDAEHAWVSSAVNYGCGAASHAWVARWRP
jgi:hypothetical protein